MTTRREGGLLQQLDERRRLGGREIGDWRRDGRERGLDGGKGRIARQGPHDSVGIRDEGLNARGQLENDYRTMIGLGDCLGTSPLWNVMSSERVALVVERTGLPFEWTALVVERTGLFFERTFRVDQRTSRRARRSIRWTRRSIRRTRRSIFRARRSIRQTRRSSRRARRSSIRGTRGALPSSTTALSSDSEALSPISTALFGAFPRASQGSHGVSRKSRVLGAHYFDCRLASPGQRSRGGAQRQARRRRLAAPPALGLRAGHRRRHPGERRDDHP